MTSLLHFSDENQEMNQKGYRVFNIVACLVAHHPGSLSLRRNNQSKNMLDSFGGTRPTTIGSKLLESSLG